MGQHIHEAAGRMRRLVDDLLDLGRLEAGDFGLRPCAVDPAELANRAIGEARLRLPDREIRAEIGRLPVVMADPDRVAQVFDNLLENAGRYAPGGPIAVRASVEGGSVRFEVADRGPGIPPAELARIFEPFYRGERGETLPVRGGGLGLSIARQLVERHGGAVGVASTIGVGSTFWFTLPAADAPRPD
jgi:signal transduction histidine kinase